MKRVVFNAEGKLRNGWWILVFIGFVAITAVLFKPLSHELKSLGVPRLVMEPVPVLLALLATWGCTRLRQEPLSSVGFRLGRRWFAQAIVGTLIGAAMLLVCAAAIYAVGGVRFELDPARSIGGLLTGLYVMLSAALLEEILFRGFIFQRMIDGIGVWPALVAMAALFALAHFGSPGMQGTTEIFAFLDIFLAGFMLGLAFVRTRSLALPVGLHLGWNWMQGHVLGFGVSGFEFAGWLKPVFQGKAEWLTGGAFGPESSVFSPVVSLVVVAMLWRWKGGAQDLPAMNSAN